MLSSCLTAIHWILRDPDSLGVSNAFTDAEKEPNPLLLRLRLLLDIVLGSSLLRLARVMLLLVLGLLGTVAGQSCNSSSDGAGDAVGGS